MEDKNDDSAKQTAITATLCIFSHLVCACVLLVRANVCQAVSRKMLQRC